MIKVLVVDDSFLMRKLISDMLKSDKEIEVIGLAKDGIDALEKIKKLKPDVITLDLEMPGIPGLDVLHETMRTMPTPVIIVSAYSTPGASETISALEYGAVDFLTKPSGPISTDIEKIKDELIRLVKVAAQVDVGSFKVKRIKPKEITNVPSFSEKVLIIGASSGGPPAIEAVLRTLPEDFPIPILIIQHMPKEFTESFADRLDKICKINVKQAQKGDKLKPGLAILAPGDYHMVLKKVLGGATIDLTKAKCVNNVRPSIDVTIESTVKYYGRNTIGIILTGMGSDGASGLALIRKSGGKTIAQDEKTSLIYGMPKVAIELGVVDFILPLQKIGKKVVELL